MNRRAHVPAIETWLGPFNVLWFCHYRLGISAATESTISGFKAPDQAGGQGVPRIESGAYMPAREHFNSRGNPPEADPMALDGVLIPLLISYTDSLRPLSSRNLHCRHHRTPGEDSQGETKNQVRASPQMECWNDGTLER
jgi:hypothetical protein